MKIGSLLSLLVPVIAAAWMMIIVRAYDPAIKNKAGPNWMWRLGRYDPVRNIFYRQDGSFRKFGRIAIALILALAFGLVSIGLTSLLWNTVRTGSG